MRSFVGALRAKQTKKKEEKEAKKTQAVQHNALYEKNQVETTTHRLKMRIEYLEGQEAQLVKQAKILAKRGDKNGALGKLRKKKMIVKEKEKLYTAIFNLEQQAFAVENAITTQDIVSGMRVGKNAMQGIQKTIDVDDVQDLRDDITEQMQTMDEVDQLLSEPLDGIGFDDDDLAAELDELDELNLVESLDELPEVPSVPVPRKSVMHAAPNTPASPVPMSPPAAPRQPVAVGAQSTHLRQAVPTVSSLPKPAPPIASRPVLPPRNTTTSSYVDNHIQNLPEAPRTEFVKPAPASSVPMYSFDSTSDPSRPRVPPRPGAVRVLPPRPVRAAADLA